MTLINVPQSVEDAAQSEAGAEEVVRRAVRGTVALGLRQVGVLVVNLLGATVLARLLSPAEFGVLALIFFARSFLVTFGDAGLGASLIRQPEEPDVADYRAVFTAQQALVVASAIALLLLGPAVSEAYDLGSDGGWLFRLLAASLVFTSFHSIPSIQLERRLAFRPLAAAGLAETLTFNVIAVLLAWLEVGVLSFGIALVAQSLVGALILMVASRWPMGLAFDWQRVRRHIGYGIPFQAVIVVSLVKDAINPVIIGTLRGAQDLGYVRWAQTFGAFSVLALMVLQRVYLPLFSRLQQDPHQLRRAVTHSIRATNAIVAPLAVISLVLAPAITRLIFGDQWLPALPIFYLLWLANLLVPTATPLLGLLNALGESRLALGFAVFWMVGTWVVGVPLILAFGAIGFGVANALVQLTNFLLFKAAQRRVPVGIWSTAGPVWIVAAAIGVVVVLVQQIVPVTSVLRLGLYTAVSLVAYAAVCWHRWKSDVRQIWAIARN